MDLNSKLSHIVELTDDEVRLIGLALARKLKEQEDILDAARLNQQFTGHRLHSLEQQRSLAMTAHNYASKLLEATEADFSKLVTTKVSTAGVG